MAEGKEEKTEKNIIFFDDNPINIRDMVENIPNIRAILVDATNIKHRYIKKYDELNPTKIATRPYKDSYMTNAAFFNTETNKYTNKYSEYVANPSMGEFHMPTEAIIGIGTEMVTNKENGAESFGIFAKDTKNNTSFIYTFIADNSIPNNRKVVIFDWDRTLTAIEGWYPEFFKDLYSNYTTDEGDLPEPGREIHQTLYKKAIADTAQYLFGGPERERILKNMFSFLHVNKISVFIITNNPTASEVFLDETDVDARKIFLDMIKIVYPQFIDSHLISTYQGKNKGMIFKSEAYNDFIAEEGIAKATEGGGQYMQSNIKSIKKQKTMKQKINKRRLTKRNMRRNLKRRNTTRSNSKIKNSRLKTTRSEKAVRRNS